VCESRLDRSVGHIADSIQLGDFLAMTIGSRTILRIIRSISIIRSKIRFSRSKIHPDNEDEMMIKIKRIYLFAGSQRDDRSFIS